MKSVLMRPPRAANSMRARCVTPRLAPSPITLARTSAAVTRSGSLARSPTSASVSGGGAHVGADAAEPEQVGLALEDGAHQLGGRQARGVDAEQRPHLVAERDRLGARARTRRRPWRSWPCRSPASSSAADRTGACARRRPPAPGFGIDEDVAVVEGRHQLGCARTAACRCRTRRPTCRRRRPRGTAALDVDVHLAEVPLDALPGAARRDRHALVVVAGRAAGGEGIAEPEIVRGRDLVGDVGEGGRALVGGDHQIGIVAVVAHHVARRHDLAVLDVVGDVEQRRDEDAVGGDALLLDLLAAAGARQLLGQEAALGARRHDDGVLDELRAHEAQHLGAEVLRPVRPADAAARDRREAQVDALDARRVDPDLAERARLRRRLHGLAVELEGERRRHAGRSRPAGRSWCAPWHRPG